MENKKFEEIITAITEKNVDLQLKLLVELICINGRTIPSELKTELANQSYYDTFIYYHNMVYYAINWHNTGYSPSKLKKLMNEAITDFSPADGLTGKRTAMRMFMDYLKYKKNLDHYIHQFNSSTNNKK